MTTQPHSARQLLQAIAGIFANPAAHGHPDIPPLGRFQIDFDGYKGVSDFIGGDLFTSAALETHPVESDLAEKFLSSPANHPDGRKAGRQPSGKSSMMPSKPTSANAIRTGTTKKVPTATSTSASSRASASKITRRFLSSRTSRV